MFTVRCSICLRRFRNLKALFIHYLRFHSKRKIVYKLLERHSGQVLWRNFARKFTNRWKKIKENNAEMSRRKKYKTDGDSNNNIEKFSFNSSSSRSSEWKWNRKCFQTTTKRPPRRRERKSLPYSHQPGTSLDDRNGVFYKCHCRQDSQHALAPFTTPTSDTESCSEASKASSINDDSKWFFCTTCGNGYATEAGLAEHAYVHEPFCRLCNRWFPDAFEFRLHMQSHKIPVFACHACDVEFASRERLYGHFEVHREGRVVDDVLDMEVDYASFRMGFFGDDYYERINSILYYLADMADMYYYIPNFNYIP